MVQQSSKVELSLLLQIRWFENTKQQQQLFSGRCLQETRLDKAQTINPLCSQITYSMPSTEHPVEVLPACCRDWVFQVVILHLSCSSMNQQLFHHGLKSQAPY